MSSRDVKALARDGVGQNLSIALRVIVALIAAACSGGSPPAPPPTPKPLPAMFNLSLVPPRPPLVWPSRTRTVFKHDLTTGRYYMVEVHDTVPGDSVAPDTNDARIYYSAGISSLYRNPAQASAALYWASRLDPSWAEPYFARWYGLRRAAAMTMRMRAAATRVGASGSQPHIPAVLPESVAAPIDSLLLLAYMRNPFVDESIYLSDIVAQTRGAISFMNHLQERMIDRVNDQRVAQGQIPVNGPQRVELPHTWFLAYASRNWANAAQMLAPLVKKNPDNLELYVYRAKALYYLKQYDSCSAVLTAAMARIESKEIARTLPVYLSKEMFSYAIAGARSAAGEASAARAAYQDAVSENLGFYMAHVNLASLALAAFDTTTAITEAGTAAVISPRDPLLQVYAGYTLLQARHQSDAVDHFRTAIAADSSYAVAYMYLGEALNELKDTAQAIDAYRQYLAHARRNDDHRTTVQDALLLMRTGRNPSGN